MNQKDKEALKEKLSSMGFVDENSYLYYHKAWKAACEYKQKEYSNLMDAMTQTSQNNAKLQAENVKLKEYLEQISVMVNDERWYDIEHALKKLENK